METSQTVEGKLNPHLLTCSRIIEHKRSLAKVHEPWLRTLQINTCQNQSVFFLPLYSVRTQCFVFSSVATVVSCHFVWITFCRISFPHYLSPLRVSAPHSLYILPSCLSSFVFTCVSLIHFLIASFSRCFPLCACYPLLSVLYMPQCLSLSLLVRLTWFCSLHVPAPFPAPGSSLLCLYLSVSWISVFWPWLVLSGLAIFVPLDFSLVPLSLNHDDTMLKCSVIPINPQMHANFSTHFST